MATTSSSNFTSLYGASASPIVPASPYGNANVVSLLAASTDGSNTIGNISATGNIVTDGYFVGSFAGNISGNLTVPGSNTQVIYNNSGNAGASSNFTFNDAQNLMTVTGNISATGNIASSYFIGNGSQLTGVTANYGNANVVANLAALGSNPVSTTGNITAGYFLGNGSQLTGLPATYGNANVTTLLSAFGSNTVSTTGNITSGNILTAGIVSATGNITGSYILGNGSQLTGLPATYGNANVAANLAAFGTNPISTAGNITGSYIFGNGSQLTGLPATYSNANVTTLLAAFGSNTISTTGNITSGNVVIPNGFGTGLFVNDIRNSSNTDTSIVFWGFGSSAFADVAMGNLQVSGVNSTISSTGNITAGNKIQGADLVAGVTISSQGNVLSVGNIDGGNLRTAGQVSATGNITGNYFFGNGSQLTGIVTSAGSQIVNGTSNVSVASNANVTVGIAGSTTATIATTGVIVNGQLVTTGLSGNISGVNTLFTSQLSVSGSVLGQLGATGNLLGANINTGGLVSATGNVIGSFFIGNGSLLTGIASTYGNANVAANLAAFGSNPISTTGNITAGNLILPSGSMILSQGNILGNLSVSNISAGILAGGIVSSYGNVLSGASGFFIGNGSLLTGIVSSYGNANVAANLAAFANNPISTTGNITGGNIIGNGSALSSITGANVTGTVANATFATSAGTATTATSATTAGTVTSNAQANITSVGVLTSLSSTGNITGANINGNGSGLSSITGANITGTVANATFATSAGSATSATTAGTVTSNAQANITSVGTLSSLSVTGNIATSGNFVGNGAALTGITATAANSATYLTASGNAAAYVSVNDTLKAVLLPGGGAISYTGDGVDPNTSGSIDIVNPQANLANAYSALTFVNVANFAANPLNTVLVGNSAVFLAYDVLGGYGGTKNITVSSAGVATNTTFSATGNVTGANVIGGNLHTTNGFVKSDTGNLNLYAAVGSNVNITASVGTADLSVSGNVTAGYFLGNGSALTGIVSTYGNANVAANLAAFANNPISTTGNVTAGYFIGNGSLLSSITGANVTGTVATATTAGTVTTAAQGNITSVGTLSSLSVTGNIALGGTLQGNSATNSVQLINYKDAVVTITYASTITPNIALGSIQQVTLTGNVTMNAFGGTPQAGQSMVIKFIQDATGGRTLTSTMKWAGGLKTLTATANAVDIASVFYDGTTYYASLTNNYS